MSQFRTSGGNFGLRGDNLVKGKSHRKRLSIRLLGGFDVRLGDTEVVGFESRKARALFAYIAAHYDQPVLRAQLAALFWPDRQEAPARRNLRQALYNIRTTLNEVLDVPDVLCSTRSTVQLSPEVKCWLDTREFRRALRIGLAGERPDPHQLALAVRLYRGDFLEGFLDQGGAAFEGWLCSEQVRLREMAIEALRALVEVNLSRGEYRIGLRMAMRLVALDPLSEEAHRYLMRLYQMAGRRGRALEHVNELVSSLDRELGVEPAAETRALREAILGDELPNSGAKRGDQPLAPLMPLVGRADGLEALGKAWDQVRRGHSRVTLVTGETGLGKTRLIRTFLDTATSLSPGLVLQGRCYDQAASLSYQPFAAILAEVLIEDPSVAERALEGHDPRLPDLVRRLAHLETTDSSEATKEVATVDREAFFAAILAVLELYTDESATSRGVPPLILFLDDLQWADEPSLELSECLLRASSGRPVWIIASDSAGRDRGSGSSVIDRLRQSVGNDRVDVVALERLTEADIEEIASSLVGAQRSTELAAFLDRHSGRLPLMLAELVNLLWDDGLLQPAPGAASDLCAPPADGGCGGRAQVRYRPADQSCERARRCGRDRHRGGSRALAGARRAAILVDARAGGRPRPLVARRSPGSLRVRIRDDPSGDSAVDRAPPAAADSPCARQGPRGSARGQPGSGAGATGLSLGGGEGSSPRRRAPGAGGGGGDPAARREQRDRPLSPGSARDPPATADQPRAARGRLGRGDHRAGARDVGPPGGRSRPHCRRLLIPEPGDRPGCLSRVRRGSGRRPLWPGSGRWRRETD